MLVSEIIGPLALRVATEQVPLTNEIKGGFASDLLSNVMGEGEPGQIWVTMQGHQNIVAVASLIGLAGIIITGDAALEPETLAKAEKNQVPLLTTSAPTFEVVGKLYSLGVGK